MPAEVERVEKNTDPTGSQYQLSVDVHLKAVEEGEGSDERDI